MSVESTSKQNEKEGRKQTSLKRKIATLCSCSVIICTKDRPADLQRCLDSLAKQTRLPDELIVVDSGSNDVQPVVAAFAGTAPACVTQHLRSAPGLTKQRNVGIRQATKDIIYFLDDDVLLDPSYIEEIQRVYETPGAEDVVAVGPAIALPRKTTRAPRVYRRCFMMTRIDGRGRLLPSGFAELSWGNADTQIHAAEVGSGCGCTFRREVFDQISFDEWFDGYGFMEDIDFTYRASRLGRMVENPRARLLHLESPSARLDWRGLIKMQIVNHHYVFAKHMPQDLYHRLCFWWSELGETLWRLVKAAKTGHFGIVAGMVDGYGAVLRNKKRQTAETYTGTGARH